MLPGKFLVNNAETFWRFFLGDEYCDKIGIRKSTKLGKRIIKTQRKYFRIRDKAGDENKFIQKILQKSAPFIVNRWFVYMAKQKRIPYYVQKK